MHELCVIIPVYKVTPTEMELRSIERTCEVLSGRDIYFVAPREMQTDNYDRFLNKENVSIQFFDARFFRGISGYNRLMLDKRFYQRFSAYTYMLIAQPDAYILSSRDQMDSFMEKGYHYWGAPWNPPLKIYRIDVKGVSFFGKFLKPVICKSGNGGFSLRHIHSTLALLKKRWITAKIWCHNFNEDGFFAYFGHSREYDWFHCPSVEEASAFALEVDMKSVLASGKKVFAVHAWEKMLDSYEELQKYIEPAEHIVVADKESDNTQF